ncbi:hypothetical protein MMC21_001756 [Puttea exsequens]|nr:hypothetical protein [Puttea exsequens]
MSVFGIERSQTNAANTYDHPIFLVDATQTRQTPERGSEEISASSSIPSDREPSPAQQSVRASTLRKQLAQRKYAKYREEGQENGQTAGESGDETGEAGSEGRASQDSERAGRLRDKVSLKGKKKARTIAKPVNSFIDVLYENQRGAFLCGIPLYSSNSLLNLDPAAWQTADFRDSAVNITNFQLPDPSWVWDWKTWYVDMSHDVDEEGWEYSFSFNAVYAWHGNHPWLFSFARRRRWLRKRVRIRPHHSEEKKGKLDQVHRLNDDYFTIHARKGPSRDSSADRATENRSSLTAGMRDNEEEEGLRDISNVVALMTALKRAIVDREKIAAVKAFIDQGGDELFYLADSMPTIMADFVHQTSRRQLQSYLLQILDEATRSNQKTERSGKVKSRQASDSDIQAGKRKIDNLLKAIHAAGVHTNDLEYWSDLRARATSSEADPTNATHALDGTEDVEVAEKGPHAHRNDDDFLEEEIKGIPEDAHVSEEPRIRFSGSGDSSAGDSAHPMDKGKGKEKAYS